MVVLRASGRADALFLRKSRSVGPALRVAICSRRGVDSKFPKLKRVSVGRVTRHKAILGSLLYQKLATRIGDARASQLVGDALERSGRSEVPDHLDDLLAFTKAHLIDDLVAALGGREVSSFFDDLESAARLASGVRRSSPHDEVRAVVGVIDHDVFRRANTARQLIARKMQVLVLHQLEELIEETARPDVLVLDEEDALSGALFRVLSLPSFDPAIVVRSASQLAASALAHAGVRAYELMANHAPAELAMAVERTLARKRA